MKAKKTRGVMFIDWSVERILAGAKTVTRRLIEPRPYALVGGDFSSFVVKDGDAFWYPWGKNSFNLKSPGIANLRAAPVGPYAGLDSIWVKEVWRVGDWKPDGRMCFDYRASSDQVRTPWVRPSRKRFDRLVKQSMAECNRKWITMAPDAPKNRGGIFHWTHGRSPCRWRSGLFMPREFSRITLPLVSVRAERLLDITDEDALLEGVEAKGPKADLFFVNYSDPAARCVSPRLSYLSLWKKLNEDRVNSENPWVWRIEWKPPTEARR